MEASAQQIYSTTERGCYICMSGLLLKKGSKIVLQTSMQ